MSVIPPGHPPIPSDVSADDVVAIITIHDPQASNANRETRYIKSQMSESRAGRTDRRTNEGCHVFLHLVAGQPCFTIGRHKARTPSSAMLDVYLPGSRIGLRQLCLIPVWDSDVWRLQSTSETISTVNGVPIQVLSNRTKKNLNPLPHAIHLQQDSVNYATINGLRLDIWLLKTVREAYTVKAFEPQPLYHSLQDVALRPEIWARDRYIVGRERVSTRSFRVVERFTGEIQTAKFFRDEHHGHHVRDEEFIKFGKAEVDASIVRYLQSVEIDSIPAVITGTHEGLTSYASLRADIEKLHPGNRFAIATKLMRRLFAALGFLHFHAIMHKQVKQESVLLRLVDNTVESVLLVDYSAAISFPGGTPLPMMDMLEDGKAAMTIVEDCCDIWQLRKAATKDAMNEGWMAKKTTEAQKEYESVQRVISDFFELQGHSRTSDKGKRLLRLLELKQNNWHTCQDDQIHNATRREVGPCIMSNLDSMREHWDSMHPSTGVGEKVFMVLSLGHPWFDSLASQLYHNRWGTTPRDVCTKFKELAGAIEEPWQTLAVKKHTVFAQTHAGIDEQCFLSWLASSCEVYPNWRKILESEYERHIRSRNGAILHHDIDEFHSALLAHGDLPQPMNATLKHLTAVNLRDRHSVPTESTHHIWCHLPSRMFNLTQLHGLACPGRLVSCVNKATVRCDDYVEVRGEPKLQGCYASLSQLPEFATQLGLEVAQYPIQTRTFPSFDPSDFSQVSIGRIVLVRTGLVAFASVTRSGDQFVFHAPSYPEKVESKGTFLPTYFGDMHVLPQLPTGVWEHARPEHWSKFKTVEQFEDATNVKKRRILKPKSLLGRNEPRRDASNRTASPSSTAMEVDRALLAQTLKLREHTRSLARPPTKRNANAQSSSPSTPSAKRSRPSGSGPAPSDVREDSNVTMSFIGRAAQRMEQLAQGSPSGLSLSVPQIPDNSSFFKQNANTLSSPPRALVDANRSFTVASGSFDLEDDWRQTEEWLKHLPAEENEPRIQGLFGFEFHHSHLRDGSETEEEFEEGNTASPGNGKSSEGKGRAVREPASQLHTPTPTSPAHVFQNGTLGGVIDGWLHDNANARGSDEDMPDTDVESFDGENE